MVRSKTITAAGKLPIPVLLLLFYNIAVIPCAQFVFLPLPSSLYEFFRLFCHSVLTHLFLWRFARIVLEEESRISGMRTYMISYLFLVVTLIICDQYSKDVYFSFGLSLLVSGIAACIDIFGFAKSFRACFFGFARSLRACFRLCRSAFLKADALAAWALGIAAPAAAKQDGDASVPSPRKLLPPPAALLSAHGEDNSRIAPLPDMDAEKMTGHCCMLCGNKLCRTRYFPCVAHVPCFNGENKTFQAALIHQDIG